MTNLLRSEAKLFALIVDFRRFLAIFWQQPLYLSQNWHSDHHFEMQNRFKSYDTKHRYFHFHFLYTNLISFEVTTIEAMRGSPSICNSLICLLCHNFSTNYDLDLFSTSKWPSDFQFCERYRDSCQKMTRNCCKMIGKTADSLLCPFHCIQFLPLVFPPLLFIYTIINSKKL